MSGGETKESADEVQEQVAPWPVEITAICCEHPLWNSILEWGATTTGPAMPWLAPGDFQFVLESFKFDPFQTQLIQKTYDHAEILRRAMFGFDYDPIRHALVYLAAGHRLGWGLCFAAGMALKSGADHFDDFAVSLRRDGLVDALEAWLRRPNILPDELDAKKEIAWTHKLSMGGGNESAANYFTNALSRSIGDSRLFMKAIVDAHGNARRDAAKLKENRAKGIKEQKPGEFIGMIEQLWIPWSLWCKPKDLILMTLQPDRKADISEAWDKISKNIQNLGFSASWAKNHKENPPS